MNIQPNECQRLENIETNECVGCMEVEKCKGKVKA